MTAKLQTTVEHDGEMSVVTLMGFLDEDNDLRNVISEIPAGVAMIDLAGVERINSCGIRDWVNWLAALEANGIKPVLVRCSPPIVAQINLVKNFVGNGAVKSFQIPFHCAECDEEEVVLVETAEMSSPSSPPPTCLCPACGRSMDVDEMPQSYFAFLEQVPRAEDLARGSSAAVAAKPRVKTRERISQQPPARRSAPSLSAYQVPAATARPSRPSRPSSGDLIAASAAVVAKRPSRPSQSRLALGSRDRISNTALASRPSAPAVAPARNGVLVAVLIFVLLAAIAALGYIVFVM